MLLILLSLSGCSYYNPIGVSYEGASGVLSVFVLPCDTQGEPLAPAVDEVAIVRSAAGGNGEVLLSARRSQEAPFGPIIDVAGVGSPLEITSGRSVRELLASEASNTEVQVVLTGRRSTKKSSPFMLAELPRDGAVLENSGEAPRTRNAYLAYLQEICNERRRGERWLMMLSVGVSAAVVITVALTCIGVVRRRRVRKLSPATIRPPAGWYPDPMLPGQLRWWDGREWSSHVHSSERNE